MPTPRVIKRTTVTEEFLHPETSAEDTELEEEGQDNDRDEDEDEEDGGEEERRPARKRRA
jgi:hypothetical protein